MVFNGWNYESQRQELCHTLFTSGGFMAVDQAQVLLSLADLTDFFSCLL